MQKKGSSNIAEVTRAMKRIATLSKRKDIVDFLESVDTVQTEYAELQSITLKDFIDWRDRTVGLTASLPTGANIKFRKAWMWVFSTQIVYALRINEVFAIKNLTEPYKTKDGVIIPALNNLDNTDNLIYIGDKTALGTTVKTGSRIARPNIPPAYPDLMERLEIKIPLALFCHSPRLKLREPKL